MALTNYPIGGTSSNKGGTHTIQLQDSAERSRYYNLAMFQQGATGANGFTQARAGVLTAGSLDNTSQIPNALKVTTASSGLDLLIARGPSVIERTASLNGTYRVASYSTGRVTLGTADATNTRWDLISQEVLDGVVGDNGGVSLTQFIVTPGTPSGTPSLPTAPPNAIPLGFVKLPPGTLTITAAMVFDIRRSAALAGAVRICLPGDALGDVGFMVGELRDTVGIGGFTQDRWNTDTETWDRLHDFTGAATRYTNFTVAQAVDNNTTAAGSYAAVTTGTTTKLGHTFVAPASGIVDIEWGLSAHSSVLGSTVFVDTAVRQGSTVGAGTSQSLSSNDEAMQFSDTTTSPASRSRPVTGLTPGTTYNVVVEWHNSGSGTAIGATPYVKTEPRDR